jgi:NADH pyrophosphatase NudC (nudix superfamily)
MTTGAASFCGHCGKPMDAVSHVGCQRRAELEPPRYCPHCARRMVVQVDPVGWRAHCSRHGELVSD